MTTTWANAAGDPSRFAIRLTLDEDPSTAHALAVDVCSWGSLELWVDGVLLTTHTDGERKYDATFWHLLPVLEWIVANWGPLLHEERLFDCNTDETGVEALAATRDPPVDASPEAAIEWEREWYSWWSRHAIRAGRSGGAFPDVVIRRRDDEIEFSWTPAPVPGQAAGVELLTTPGSARVPVQDVAPHLHSVVSAAVEELHSRAPEANRVGELANAVSALTAPSKQMERYGWLAGVGSSAASAASGWRRIRNQLASSSSLVRRTLTGDDVAEAFIPQAPTLAIMFGSLSPSIAAEDVAAILELLTNVVTTDPEPTGLVELSRNVPLTSDQTPAQQGYDLAEITLDELGLGTEGPIDIDAALDKLGVHRDAIDLTDDKIRGLSVAGPYINPVAVSNERLIWDNERVRRFTLAHELTHLLYDRSAGGRLAVASGPWAPAAIEQRANAFAAMFLMPPAVIEHAIAEAERPSTEWEGILEIGVIVQVSPSSVLEHMRARGLIDTLTYQRLRSTGRRRRSQ